MYRLVYWADLTCLLLAHSWFQITQEASATVEIARVGDHCIVKVIQGHWFWQSC